MKTIRLLLAALSITTMWAAQAQDDISGIWAGMLAVAPGTSIEIHFVLTQDGDGYSAVITSPNPDGIQNVPATNVSFDAGQLAIDVRELSGRYEGSYADGRFTGSWQQQGAEIPLALAPYVERTLTDEGKDLLRGSWVGELSAQQVTLAIVFRFEDNDAGAFVGFLDSPDQGANGIAVTGITLQDGILELSVPQISATYRGELSGDSIDGTFMQLGMPLPLALTRGEYVQKGLELSQEAIEQLEGSWVGQVNNAAGASLPIVFRFEAADDGRMKAYLDSPEQGVAGLPVSEVTLEQGRLLLVIPAAQASFTATVSGAEMQGTWAQGLMSQPVTLARGEYQPAAVPLDLSAEAMTRLAGTWSGQLGPLEIFVRFETGPDGAPVAFLDVPMQGASGVVVSAAELADDELTVRIQAINVTLTGTLANDEITGRWQQGQASTPVTLARDAAP